MSRYPTDRSEPPPQPPTTLPYKFTTDELRVLRECNREAFYKRCLPFGALFGGSIFYCIKAGYMGANGRFGIWPKVTSAVIVGYFLGKFSYQTVCAEKLMRLPNSPVGAMLRKRRQGPMSEAMQTGTGTELSLGPLTGVSPAQTYSDLGPSTLEMDTTHPSFSGLDDTYRPSLDNPITPGDDDELPLQKSSTSYDELRRKNREDYQEKLGALYRPTPKPQQPVAPVSPPSMVSPKITHKNKYGDEWE